MKMTIEESRLNFTLKQKLEKIFENKTFKDLSNYERRKCVFEYLVNNNEYDFSLLDDIYSGKPRYYADEILSVLDEGKENKGVCNSFSYAYKILLDKLQIPCILVVCKVGMESISLLDEKEITYRKSQFQKDFRGLYQIPHMLVMVQNEDGTFSFDDITHAIFNKGTENEQTFFNYNYQTALQHKQTNFQGLDTDILRFIIDNSKDTKNDEIFRKRYGNKKGFLNLPFDLIKSYKKRNKFDYLEKIV